MEKMEKEEKLKILVVDDNHDELEIIKELFQREVPDWEIITVDNGREALNMVREREVNVVLIDVRMPIMSGVEMLKYMRKLSPHTPVFMMTSYGEVKAAVNCIKLGAYDYLEKPLSDKMTRVLVSIRNAAFQKMLSDKTELLEMDLQDKYRFKNIIGNSEGMLCLFALIKKMSNSDVNVLIYGESGTGKELVARAIHFHSSRRSMKFVPASCAALSEGIIESELFGHVRGAFTGALKDKKGLFTVADSGTIFLDEISEVPPSIQVKLLRVIQEGEVSPVGSEKVFRVDVRVIAATNVDLEKAVKEGRFREDLFYRLNVVNLDIPPLRERRSDIPLLVNHFIGLFNSGDRVVKGVEPIAMEMLNRYDWPGNVRELENCIARAFAVGSHNFITIEDFPREISGVKAGSIEADKSLSFKDYEKMAIQNALLRNGNDVKLVSEELGVGLSTLYRKMKNYSIEIKKWKKGRVE